MIVCLELMKETRDHDKIDLHNLDFYRPISMLLLLHNYILVGLIPTNIIITAVNFPA